MKRPSRRATIRRLALLLSGALIGLGGPSAIAQTSDRPLILVVPFPPGGSTDIVARIL